MIRLVYELAFFLGLLAGSPYFLLRMLTTRRFRQGLAERLGRYSPPGLFPGEKTLWVQAASVGEVNAAAPLLKELRRAFPGRRLVLSCQTASGRRRARESLSPSDSAVLSPLDAGIFIRRFLRNFSPEILVLIETEIWPGLIMACRRGNIPVVLCNGRISDASFPRYRAARILLRPLLEKISGLGMRTPEDAGRVAALGAPPGRIRVTGNLKYDAAKEAAERAPVRPAARLGIGPEQTILVGGSTAPGEEILLFRSWRALRSRHPGLRLFLAPRHLERLPEILRELEEAGAAPALFSEPDKAAQAGVVVVDVFGVLYELYGAADLVFVGRSLSGRGGQNPIEPASRGRAVVFGPGMNNFREDTRRLLAAGGAGLVPGPGDLTRVLGELLDDPERRAGMGRAAREAVFAASGAAGANLEMILEVLSERSGGRK